MKAIAVLVIVLALTGCVRLDNPEPEPPVDARTEVPWEDYPGSLQQIIDEEQAEGDCVTLQEMFDIQFTSSDSVLERTGHGNTEVLSYIDEALELADCYD